MVLPSGVFGTVFFIGTVTWLVVVTILVGRMVRHYNRLTTGVTKIGLTDILESVLAGQQDTKKRLRDIEVLVQHLVGDGKKHIQRIGVVRFNPFRDTGGSQSFTVALLSEKEDGLVMTSLYARNGNRWYIKEVHGGKPKDVDLSQEEEAAIKRARVGVAGSP